MGQVLSWKLYIYLQKYNSYTMSVNILAAHSPQQPLILQNFLNMNRRAKYRWLNMFFSAIDEFSHMCLNS